MMDLEPVLQSHGRKPWLAALLSLIVPGLGQVYSGRLLRGLILFILPCIGLFLSYMVGLATAPSGIVPTILFLGCPGILFLYLFIPIDAYRQAKKNHDAYVLKGFNRWYVYVGIAVIGWFLLSGIVGNFREYGLEPYVSPTGSMIPTSLPGDRFYVDKRVDRFVSELRRGQLIVFKSPKDETTYMKRIIGLPGDKIDFVNGRMKINGISPRLEKVDASSLESEVTTGDSEFYRERIDGSEYLVAYAKSPRIDTSSFTVPEGEVFVLGDNRDNSFDSRQYGSVPIKNIRGKPLQVWFSAELSPLKIRWNRIGVVLR